MASMLMDSPVGRLRLTATDDGLTEVLFVDETDGPPADGSTEPPRGSGADAHRREYESAGEQVVAAARQQLEAYFAGNLREFDLPLAAAGSDFQRRVWGELATIPYATTVSYGEVAARLGLVPGASRAVGLANGQNPLAIVVPCHRVIGADGTLTGYAGGLERKRYLLDLETRQAGPDALF